LLAHCTIGPHGQCADGDIVSRTFSAPLSERGQINNIGLRRRLAGLDTKGAYNVTYRTYSFSRALAWFCCCKCSKLDFTKHQWLDGKSVLGYGDQHREKSGARFQHKQLDKLYDQQHHRFVALGLPWWYCRLSWHLDHFTEFGLVGGHSSDRNAELLIPVEQCISEATPCGWLWLSSSSLAVCTTLF
jgi:hypothetical protein